MVLLRATVASLFTLVAACSVGEVPIGGGGMVDAGNNTAQAAAFDTAIKPLVTPKCTGCHGGGTAPNLSSYMALEAKYKTGPGATNILVTKGDATGGQHQGVAYFDAAQKTAVANWIDGK